MARKFQIGDTVQVVKYVQQNFDLTSDFKIGHRGVIIAYDDRGVEYPYTAKRKNGNMEQFDVRELKLIKRKTKKQKK